ncbi:Reticulon-like protein B17 [Striga hermonthica]|uniref:Reticulon-like protein n=1 Tax=Striga hermonthica TaxID=68872 RepID=A0A9N7R5P7_STRHE|nr:Reticulon-like protein B17 [Striga hermonthica]
MDSTPPPPASLSSARPKSTSRLSKLRHYSGSPIPQLSLEIVPSSPKVAPPSPEATEISPRPPYTLPLKEFLVLSPSPLKKPKARLAERPEVGDEGGPVESFGVRKRCKNRNSIASPRSVRRSRRKLEQDVAFREERESLGGEEILVKPRKKRHGERPRKEKSAAPSKVPSPRTIDGVGYNIDAIGEIINDLVMWKDVSKSSLWFGFGSLCFLSSCFARGVNFSIFSIVSRVGLLFLGLAFFSNSMRKRTGNEIKHEFKLNEDDILRVGRLMLPAANLAISKTRQVFSGEPAMTLKVVPIFLVGAEYGHLITLWRLCALGFFISFTGPKLYSAYSSQILKKVEYLKTSAMEAWGSCTHKRVVAASAVTAFWNLTSIRTRIFAAFLCLVMLKYHRQQWEVTGEGEEGKSEAKPQEQEKAIVAVEIESNK